MALSYCDSVIDFDLNILQQSENEAISTIQNTKQNKAFLRLKERIISTESVIKRYCKKKLQLQETQKKWKKTCLDYSDALKKVYDLENDLQSHKQQVEKLTKVNGDLQQSYEYAETAKLAFKAHVVQLQVLMKEHEQRIENLKSENKDIINKDTKLQQECNKKLLASRQENKQLLYHIKIFRNLIIQNKKPNKYQKRILKKYENCQDMSDMTDSNDDENHAESDIDVNYVVHDKSTKSITVAEKAEEDKQKSFKKIPSPVKEGKLAYGSNMLEECIQPSCQSQEVQGKIITEACKNKVANNHACAFEPDLEISNEPAYSVDTGCGSSLAYSDIEKGFFSSEYSESNSPVSIDTLMTRKEVNKSISVATSPITVFCTQDVGTNPIKFFDYKSIGVQHDNKYEECNVYRSYKDIDVQCDILSKQLCRNVEIQCELKSIDKEVKTVSTQCGSVSNEINVDVNQYSEVATHSDVILEVVNKPEIDKSSVTANVIKSPTEKCKHFDEKQHKIVQQKTLPLIVEDEELNRDDIDTEVTTILNEMRLGFGKVTPIPLSPVPHSSKNSHTAPHLESEHQTLSSQLLVLNKTVMAIATALKIHGINISNVNENVFDAKDSSNNKSMSSEKDKTEEFDNNSDICTEKIKVNQHSQKNCNLVNEKKLQNVFVFESENNLEHSNNEQQENETVEMENTLECVNFESLAFPKEVIDDQNNANKVYEKERKRGIKKSKVTKLQKIRKNALPKYKIKKELTLIQRNKSPNVLNRKSFIHKEPNKKLKSIEILNNKAAYEKALRVVADMRQKEKDNLAKKYGKKTIFLKPNTKKKVMLVPSKQIQCSDVQSKKVLDDIFPDRQEDCSNQTSNKSLTSPILLTKSLKQSIPNGNNLLQISNKNIEISKLNDNIKKCNTDDPRRNKNVSHSKCLESLGPVKKQEIKQYTNLKNRSLIAQVPNEKQECRHSESVLVNGQQNSLMNEDEWNTFNAIRQNTRLSTKRLSESEVENRTNKRQKRSSRNFDKLMCKDKILTSDNSRTSIEKSDTGNIKLNALLNESDVQIRRLSNEEIESNIKLNALQNNSVVYIRRLSNEEIESNIKQVHKCQAPVNKTNKQIHLPNRQSSMKSYDDLDMFSENTNNITDYSIQNHNSSRSPTTQKGYFCQILERYLKNKRNPKPLSGEMVKNIYMELDSNIEEILNLKNTEVNGALKKFAESMQDVNTKPLVAAIIAFLQRPKKVEDVICKTSTPPAPPMAKSEQILLYLLKHLNCYHDDCNLFDMMMDSIAYKLFKLNNQTPSFEEVESLSHFYAVLCRYTRAKNKLRLFVLDAMYCLSYKAIPVIKQCLDVWMHILPLAHMGLAKSPLVVTLVYLLHFYRCDDESGRVQNIRMLLRKRYSYDMGDWNETKILEMFKDAIAHIRDIPIEKKMLRTSLILIAKRNGVEWCQKNIVTKLLLPMIENYTTPKMVRAFCVSLLGAVMRPYPKHMRLHCEIVVNQLFVMLEQEKSPQFQEALFTSLIYLSKHSLNQVVTALLAWEPSKVSPALEELLKDFVQEKSLKSWHYILTQNSK